jgi:hypothetical protein
MGYSEQNKDFKNRGLVIFTHHALSCIIKMNSVIFTVVVVATT